MKHKEKFTFLLGLGLGLASWGVYQNLISDEEKIVASEPLEQKDDRKLLKDKLSSQKLEIARLKKRIQQLSEESVVEEVGEVVEQNDRHKQRMQRMRDERLAMWTAKLGLDESQIAAVSDLFTRRSENHFARRNGEDVSPLNVDEELKSILTEEQYDAYMEESQQEIIDRAEVMAVAQTTAVLQEMDLSPEQEDVVYDAIFVSTQEMMNARAVGEDYEMGKALDEQLAPYLSEEEIEIVKDQKPRREPAGL